MKAEHRKELQTNALADRMGRFFQRMRARPQRKSFLLWFLVIAGLVVLVGYLYVRSNKRKEYANLWTLFEASADYGDLKAIVDANPETLQARLAKHQFAWQRLWNDGIEALRARTDGATESILNAQALYAELAEEADDPILIPEALYNIALAEESLAASPFLPEFRKGKDGDLGSTLVKAQSYYLKLANHSKYGQSVLGKLAAKRAKDLEPGGDQWREILRSYSMMRIENPGGMFPQGHNPLLRPDD